MQNRDMFGEIRSKLQHPSPSNWKTITKWIRAWPDARERDEVILPYCLASLRAWPDHLRVADTSWFERLVTGEEDRSAWRAAYALARRLSLGNDTIALRQWKELLDLDCWSELRSLSLRSIKFGGARGFEALIDSGMLAQLSHLAIQDIDLDAGSFDALLEQFAEMPRLRALEFERARLTNRQLDLLLKARIARRLRALSLRDNNLDARSCQIIQQAPTLPELERLFLGAHVDSPYFTSRHNYYNHFGKHGFELLTRNNTFPALRGLELAYHKLTVSELSAITIETFPALCMLDVRNNNLHGDGLGKFLQTPLAKQLTHIDLSNNAIDEDALDALVSTHRKQPLRSLLLNGVRPGIKSIRALARSPELEALERLELAENNLGAELLLCFDEQDRFPALKRLNIAGNKPPDHVTAAILRSATARHIEELDLRIIHIGARTREALLTPNILPELELLRLSPPIGKHTPDVYLAGTRLHEVIRYDYYSNDPTHQDLFSPLYADLTRSVDREPEDATTPERSPT